MRFGFFLRVPWWLMLLVFAIELAAWIVILPFFAIWKLWDWRLSIRDDAALGIPRLKPARTRPGALGAYRDWMDRHDPRLGEDDHR
jgi:hypothetical protein